MKRSQWIWTLAVIVAVGAVAGSAAAVDETWRLVPAAQPEIKDPNPPFIDPTAPPPVTEATGGPDAFGYVFIDSTEPGGPVFQWVELNATGTQVLLSDDATAGPFPIGFTFSFYGTDYTEFYVSSNGWMSLAAPAGSDLSNDCPLPNAGGPGTLIGLHWDDLDPGDNSDPIWYQSFAAGACPYGGYPGACLVVEYEDFCHYPGGATCASAGTFEGILFDDGEMLIQFLDPGAETGASSTTGIQNSDGTIGLSYPCNTAGSIAADLAILYFVPLAGDLAITKTAPSGFAISGPFPFAIDVQNLGPEDQTGVEVVDVLPAELDYISDTCGGGAVGQTWTWTIGDLANGASASCELWVAFNVPDCPTVTNTATVTGDVFDPPANSSSSISNSGEQVADGSFEAGSPSPFWTEFSLNFGTPLCTIGTCGTGTGTGPRTGDWWTWFGGISAFEEGSMTQTVVIPPGANTLEFWLEMIVCDSPADYMEVTIDGTQVYLVDGGSPLCGVLGYSQQLADISAFADGGAHILEFHSEIFAVNAGGTNFFVDDVSIAAPGCGPPLGPPNDFCPDAIELNCPGGGGTDIVQGSTVTATFTDQGTCGTSHSAPEVWYRVTGNGGGMSVTTCSANSTYDTKLTVWEGACEMLGCVDGNDDMGSTACPESGLLSEVAWMSVDGTEYYIMVHGFGSGVGDFELTLTCDIPVELQSIDIE